LSQQADSLDVSPELAQEIDACRKLAAGAVDDNVNEADLNPLRTRVDAQIEQEKGIIATLRALPTWQRTGIALGLAAAVTLASLVTKPRSDLDAYPMGHMAWIVGLLAALTFAASWRLLRPLHKPPPKAWTDTLLLVLGVLTPAVVSFIPLGHVGIDAGTGADFAAGCMRCIGFGGVLGIPVLVLALVLRRKNMDGAAITALGGVAAGLSGNLVLQVHCPITDSTHLLLGHTTLLLILGAAAVLLHRK
jgi:hypothetical protein